MGSVISIRTCLDANSRGFRRLEVVQVVRPDGKYEEFAEPVEVSMVMRMHPDHLLVHCCSSRALDHRPADGTLVSKIMIMRPDQELAVGQSYLLHPIPPQYRRTMFKTHCIPLPKSPLGLGPPDDTDGLLKNVRKGSKKVKKLSSKRAKRLATLRDLCADLLQPLQPVMPSVVGTSSSMLASTGPRVDVSTVPSIRRTSLLAEAPNAPLLDSRLSSSDDSISDGGDDESPRSSSFGFNGWRPALDSIPESPGRSFGTELQPSTHTLRYHRLADLDGSMSG